MRLQIWSHVNITQKLHFISVRTKIEKLICRRVFADGNVERKFLPTLLNLGPCAVVQSWISSNPGLKLNLLFWFVLPWLNLWLKAATDSSSRANQFELGSDPDSVF
jgi:hypothetical protein